MGYSPPGSSVHEILQARILEWVTIPFSRGSSWRRDQTQVSCIAGRFFTIWAIIGRPILKSFQSENIVANQPQFQLTETMGKAVGN